MQYEDKPCGCGSNYIVNKRFWLCNNCNYKRLHNGLSQFDVNKTNQKPKKKVRIKSSKKTKEKRIKILEKDRELYLKVFNLRPCECENCKLDGINTSLPDIFEDDNGDIVAIWQYSHILAKSRYPQFRHIVKNINRLCLKCHTQWDHGNKKLMPIYTLNQSIIKELKGV